MKVLEPTNESEDYAFRILRNALYKPFNKLAENAGMNSGKLLAELERKKFGFGVDVIDGEIKDMLASGIADPALVAISAIQNAISTAIAITTSDGIIAEIEEEKK